MDGRLWWLRWFDYLTWDRTTSTASVTVALSLLPETTCVEALPLLDSDTAATATQQFNCDVHTGLIPALVIGTVYRNGSYVGLLPSMTRTFKFERTRCVVEFLAMHKPRSSAPLFRWEANQSAFAIGQDAYALRGYDDSICLRIRPSHGSGEQLVLPCPEIFRTLFAPHRAIALALTNGPWEHTQNQVLHMRRENPEDEPTRIREDGSWHVALRGGVGPAFAVTLGNLVLNPTGKRAANLVWASVIERPQSLQKVASDDGRPRLLPVGRLRAQIPFDWDVLDIEVRGFQQISEPETWIGLQIISVTWPSPPTGPPSDVWWTPWMDTTQGEIRTPVDKPARSGGVREAGSEEGYVTKDVDPSVGSQAVPVEAPGLLWKNSPRLHRKRKRESHIYLGRARGRSTQETSAVSTGNAVPGPTGAGTAQTKAKPRQAGSNRFTEVLKMFNSLQTNGYIDSYGRIPPGPQEAEHRGDVAAWRFPHPKPNGHRPSLWCLVDQGMDVTRAAMVCVVRHEGAVLYWIEIELRKQEAGYRSLLFTVDEGNLDQVVLKLLEIAVRKKGIWPDTDVLVAEAAVSNAIGWTHSQTDGALNGDRALVAIGAVLHKVS